MSEDNKQFMQRFVEEVINKKNLDAVNELVAEDFVEHIPFPGQVPGLEGLKQARSIFWSAVPNLRWILDEQIAEGEKVVSRFTMTGTHRGELRGEAVVQVVSHHNLQVKAQDYYSGEKESEVPMVRKLLNSDGLASQKISFDALHCNPATLELIAQKKGKYVVGLKENQKQMEKQISLASEKQPFLAKLRTAEKGHERIELRKYEFYAVLEMEKEARWKNCQIRTAIKVKREGIEVKSGKKDVEESYYTNSEQNMRIMQKPARSKGVIVCALTSCGLLQKYALFRLNRYYLSNLVGNYEELAEAIRKHWSVETNNHVRDVSFKEDKMRSKKRSCSKQWQA